MMLDGRASGLYIPCMHYPALFDSHFHLHSANLEKICKPVELITGCTCATHEENWAVTLMLAKNCSGLTPFIGVHPWFTGNCTDTTLQHLHSLLIENPRCGIGEVGLDKMRQAAPLAEQRTLFRAQLALASEYKRPVSVHCVRAWGALCEELDYYGTQCPSFSVHAFSGSVETMQKLVSLGGKISFSPFVLEGNNRRAPRALRECPENALLLDTDFPSYEDQPIEDYFPMCDRLYSMAAEIRGVSQETLSRTVYKNAQAYLSCQRSPDTL